ncbi:DUF1749-domain-containing protein [Basidiobolus meristosporus CBS 931.73]|uniref:DUF1749-domain-containing protein n=1 Tax=Basidiobolus meristosporus CBS 931.73 TaxID=1314790 RepID=A0A1Y1XTH3_9FUNG|nr:DUF1749-domain-containing protein [Basidiobolus meristosporus CBS 931.73]|eukprot:ORX89052.1 DUF1749-domain-containing protein [Basidiobolus meristosporus CBS 931.73]
MELSGTLFQYSSTSRLVGFESGDASSPGCVVFIAGLTDGFHAVPYLPVLNDTVNRLGYSLVQVLLSSSYHGYGVSSLSKDASEIDELIEYLVNKKGKKKIVLLGHSTGCQDAIWYVTNGKLREHVAGCILQGAVSDREYMVHAVADFQKHLDHASRLVQQGKGEELMPREVDPDTPTSAYRFHSLAAHGGDDDMFSSDLSELELAQIYTAVATPISIALSGKDEYMDDGIDKASLLAKIQSACPKLAMTTILDGADHAVSQPQAQQEFMRFVGRFIDHLG